MRRSHCRVIAPEIILKPENRRTTDGSAVVRPKSREIVMKTKTLAVLMTALSIGVSPVGTMAASARDAPILPKKGAAENNQSSGGATQQPDAGGATSSGGAGASSSQDAQQQPSGSDGNSSGASTG